VTKQCCLRNFAALAFLAHCIVDDWQHVRYDGDDTPSECEPVHLISRVGLSQWGKRSAQRDYKSASDLQETVQDKRKKYGNAERLRGTIKTMNIGRQFPRGLRPESAAARLLGLRVRIPPGTRMSLVNVACCLVAVSALDWALVQRSPTECGVIAKSRQ